MGIRPGAEPFAADGGGVRVVPRHAPDPAAAGRRDVRAVAGRAAAAGR